MTVYLKHPTENIVESRPSIENFGDSFKSWIRMTDEQVYQYKLGLAKIEKLSALDTNRQNANIQPIRYLSNGNKLLAYEILTQDKVNNIYTFSQEKVHFIFSNKPTNQSITEPAAIIASAKALTNDKFIIYYCGIINLDNTLRRGWVKLDYELGNILESVNKHRIENIIFQTVNLDNMIREATTFEELNSISININV